MTIIDSIGSGFKSLGSWISSEATVFKNKVAQPVINVVSLPFKSAYNIASGTEKMTEVWAKRADSITNDTINAVDNTVSGIGNFFKTPILPIALGLGALYIIKK